MTERPWIRQSDDYDRFACFGRYGDPDCCCFRCQWVGELELLAPKMAETILDFQAAVDSNSGDDSQRVHEQMYRMADKLRKIGANHA
jgi:hypothetical protein